VIGYAMNSSNSDDIRNAFDRDGFVVIDGFLNDNEINALQLESEKILDDFDFKQNPVSVFSTYDETHSTRDRYFLESSDKIRFFYEEKAFDANGTLLVDKKHAINKVGHGLHLLNPVFKRISHSSKVKDVVQLIGYEDPAIVQSMYIFKQPGIGGEVTPHQDATFLRTEPIDHLIGLWFALEDATLENGCLWFVPESHKTVPLTRKYIRNNNCTEGAPLLTMVGEQSVIDDNRFIPVPVKKGGLVLIHGLVLHKSAANTSAKSRHAYTFHIMERKNTKWCQENWLQLTSGTEFPSLFQ